MFSSLRTTGRDTMYHYHATVYIWHSTLLSIASTLPSSLLHFGKLLEFFYTYFLPLNAGIRCTSGNRYCYPSQEIYYLLHDRSLTITALGIIAKTIGLHVSVYSRFRSSTFLAIFVTFGWAIMLTGSSLVLYSRLYLILPNPKLLRIILFIIFGNAAVFQIPNIVIAFIPGNVDSVP